MGKRGGVVFGLLLAAAAMYVSSASGTFTGANGRIAFTMQNESGTFHVFTMNPDGSGVVQVTTDPATGAVTDRNPRWSPDGKRIAFSSDRDGDFDIWVVDANGSGLRQVTGMGADGNLDVFPAWTADGQQIVFQRRFSDGIWVTDANAGGGERKLADGFVPGTSSRGRKVVYTAPDGDLRVLNLDDGTTRRLDGTTFDAEANWSPTGNDLVFSGTSPGEDYFDTYIMHADGTRLRQLNDTNSNSQEGSPVWSPDGTRIAIATCEFTDAGQQNCSIQTMRPDGSDLTTIPIQGALYRVGGRIDWQPIPR